MEERTDNIHECLQSGNIENVKLLVDNNPELLTKADDKGLLC